MPPIHAAPTVPTPCPNPHPIATPHPHAHPVATLPVPDAHPRAPFLPNAHPAAPYSSRNAQPAAINPTRTPISRSKPHNAHPDAPNSTKPHDRPTHSRPSHQLPSTNFQLPPSLPSVGGANDEYLAGKTPFPPSTSEDLPRIPPLSFPTSEDLPQKPDLPFPKPTHEPRTTSHEPRFRKNPTSPVHTPHPPSNLLHNDPHQNPQSARDPHDRQPHPYSPTTSPLPQRRRLHHPRSNALSTSSTPAATRARDV